MPVTHDKMILVIGTFDTKEAELTFMAEIIRAGGGGVLTMDVSVLGEPSGPTDFSKHDVATAGGSTIRAAIDTDSENRAMQIMAAGASSLAATLYAAGRFDGVLLLGGSMGTDLALDVCAALPPGVPKYIVSTISFSPLIPAERVAADTQMILWAGGLYGLNPVCRASLSQAAGAVLGAARAVRAPVRARPLIGMTSLGKSALSYMVRLKPELEARGFEVAVFHATGMGGRAFESLAANGAFACVFDFCTQELGNYIHGSDIHAGEGRLTHAGRAGVPQLVSCGCYDLVDIVGWQGVPEKWAGHLQHAHNRLITSIVLDVAERRQVAQAHCTALAGARGPTALLLAQHGFGEWDRKGATLHNAAGLAAFLDEMRTHCPQNVECLDIDGHINDDIFADAALELFDEWCARGIVKTAGEAIT